MGIRRVAVSAALALVLLSIALPARAWIYPEHRAIAGTAIEGLAPEERAVLDALWAEARKGHEERLCDTPWAGDQGEKPGCLDWSAWPAIAGEGASTMRWSRYFLYTLRDNPAARVGRHPFAGDAAALVGFPERNARLGS